MLGPNLSYSGKKGMYIKAEKLKTADMTVMSIET